MHKKLLVAAIAATLISPTVLAQSQNRTVIVGGQFPNGNTQVYQVPPGGQVVIVPNGRPNSRTAYENMMAQPPAPTGNEALDGNALAAHNARMRTREMINRHNNRQ